MLCSPNDVPAPAAPTGSSSTPRALMQIEKKLMQVEDELAEAEADNDDYQSLHLSLGLAAVLGQRLWYLFTQSLPCLVSIRLLLSIYPLSMEQDFKTCSSHADSLHDSLYLTVQLTCVLNQICALNTADLYVN